ncbi:MAG TPA: TetR/AcrR family transcriptional regulator [Bradyrhizobium sp.]|nr:TetR/AcrR family transcriptional regulator [Bradyrhizobium sp.]
MSTASSKHQRVVEGATEVFCRYGFARTTMGDIAERCGISRPALYLLFSDKEAVFTAVVEQMDRDKLAAIRAEVAHLKSLHDKLLHACLAWGCHGIDLAAKHPDAGDLFDLRYPVVQQVYRNFQSLVVELISERFRAAHLKMPKEQAARALVFGMRGLRETAADSRDMQNLITSLVDIFVRAIER